MKRSAVRFHAAAHAEAADAHRYYWERSPLERMAFSSRWSGLSTRSPRHPDFGLNMSLEPVGSSCGVSPRHRRRARKETTWVLAPSVALKSTSRAPDNNAMNLTRSSQTAWGPRRSIQCSADSAK